MILNLPQPDQQPDRWDDHVSVYEAVFEPFTTEFARTAIAELALAPGAHVLDVGAGSGGAALELAAHGMRITAIDASVKMCARIAERAGALPITAVAMDGQALTFDDATFDAAVSVFGVILFPNAVKGLAEMRRVVKPGGRIAVVTWTEPQNYELAAALREAVVAVRPNQPQAGLPAQLRYRERTDFAAFFTAAGLRDLAISAHSATLRAPSARWLAARIAFAPGMAAQLDGLGTDRDAVLDQLTANLEARFGPGEVSLAARAFVGTAAVA